MEDEKTKVNENNRNNKNNVNESSKSSSNNDKYKRRKTSSDNNPKKSVPNRNNAFSRIKQGAKDTAFRKAADTIPGVKTLNDINNMRKGVSSVINRRRNTGVGSAASTGVSEEVNEDNGEVENNTSISDDVEKETSDTDSFNPLRAIFGSKNSFMGRFSFWGRLSLPMKIIIIAGPALLGLFLLIIILAIPLGAHSSLFGLDNPSNNSGSTSSIDYGDYILSSDGHTILHQQLSSFLQSQGTNLEEFNSLIASNVEDAGYRTRAGVVSAAVTLIAELGNKYSVKIPYFWSGGHASVSTGADGNWGNGSCRASANGVFYNYCGLDCSGFVTWALNNGGFATSPLAAGSFQNLPGAERVALTDSAVLQPGDLLETSGHVVLVVGVEGSQYVCAEASGNSTGVLFTRRNFNIANYWGVKMDGYYGLTG